MLNSLSLPQTIPWLTLLQLLPFITGLILIRLRNTAAFALALFSSTLELLLAIHLYQALDKNLAYKTWQFGEQLHIFRALQYQVGLDGLNMLFILLASCLVFLLTIFIALRNQHGTSSLAVIMLTLASIMSQLLTLDLLWFFGMSFLEVVFIGYMIKRWGTEQNRMPTVIQYFQFMFLGLTLFGIGVLLLGIFSADELGHWTFSLPDLINLDLIPRDSPNDTRRTVGVLVFYALFYGLALRIPLFPFHGWLVNFMQHGTVTMAPLIILGIKVGIYALLRFVFPIVPEAIEEWRYAAVIFAFIGIFYAAVLAMRQSTLRELLAYAVISHTGILTIGLFTLNEAGFQGALLLALNFGLAIAGLLLMTGLLWHRTKTTRLRKLGGLFDYLPLVGVAFLVAGLAIIGMPGTPGFNGVHAILEASINQYGAFLTLAAAIGNLIAAGFLLHSFQVIFLKPLAHNKTPDNWDTRPPLFAEKVIAGTVIILIIGIGFYDRPWLVLLQQPIHGLTASFHPQGTH